MFEKILSFVQYFVKSKTNELLIILLLNQLSKFNVKLFNAK